MAFMASPANAPSFGGGERFWPAGSVVRLCGFFPRTVRARVSAAFPVSRRWRFQVMAEGVGFEPTVGLPLLLISSQVPLTTQPPFQTTVFTAFLSLFQSRRFAFSILMFYTVCMKTSKTEETTEPEPK